MDVKLEAGVGVQQLFGLHNSLEEVVSSEAGISSSNTNINADQQNVNTLIPLGKVGIRLERSVATGHRFFLRYPIDQGFPTFA